MPNKMMKVKCGDTESCASCQSFSSAIAESPSSGLFTMNGVGRCDFYIANKQTMKIEAAR